MGIHLDLHFRTVEIYRPGFPALGAHYLREGVQAKYSLSEFVSFRHGLGIDICLGLLIAKSVITPDDGTAYPARLDFRLGSHLKYGGEHELILIRAQGAELVAQFLGQHRHRAVHKVH